MIDQEKLDAMIAEFEQMRKEMQEKFQEAFHSMISKFWEENPKIHCMTWVQYTPYFNDGEPCRFRMGDIWIMTKEVYDLYKEERNPYAEEWNIIERDYDTDRKNEYKTNTWKLVDIFGEDEEKIELSITLEEAQKAWEMVKVFQKIPDEVFLMMFGDHQHVVATKDGFEVEEYEHE